MSKYNKQYQMYLLLSLASLSSLDLSGYQAALLFIVIAGIFVSIEMRRRILMPTAAFISMAYIFGYPLPILLPGLYEDIWARIPPDALEYGMLWAVRGYAAFAIGYMLTDYYVNQDLHDKGISPDGFRYAIYLLKIIGWTSLIGWFVSAIVYGMSLTFIEGDSSVSVGSEGSLRQILTLLSNLRYPFILGYIVLYYYNVKNSHLKVLFILIIGVSVIEIITIGSKGSIIRLMLSMLLVFAIVPIRLRLRLVMLGPMVLLVVYGVFLIVTEYRSIIKYEHSPGDDVFDISVQIESFMEAILRNLPSSDGRHEEKSIVSEEEVLSRFSAGMFGFSNLLYFTGRQSPYENKWESLFVPIYSIIPRALMPEKPVFFDSGGNAKRYYGWSYGGISVTLLGSFYFALGYIGILFGMAFIGGMLSYVEARMTSCGAYYYHWLVLFVTLVLPLMDIGSTFQSILINFFRVYVILWVVKILYQAKTRKLVG